MDTFEELGLSSPILKALEMLNYKTPSEIQAKAIPELLTQKTDIKAFAQTGTGKTAAFSLPILAQIDPDQHAIQALVLSPTRELALQIGRNIEAFSTHLKQIRTTTVYGGGNIETQIKAVKKGVAIVVGTPGRTLDLIRRGVLDLKALRWLVLDEADEMLNMGFKEELDSILATTPKEKQTLLFSATFPKEVAQIAQKYLNDPLEIQVGKRNAGTANVLHTYYQMSDRHRYMALKRVMDTIPNIYAIIFCRTRRETIQIAEKLMNDGYNADSLHGDLSQAQRDTVMQKFRNKSIAILVATDVAARGLDIDNLSHVINYRLPDQIETYNHRSGRTGRAGNLGTSVLLLTPKEYQKLKPIERKIQQKLVEKPIPSITEICESQLNNLIEKVKDAPVASEKVAPYLPQAYELLKDLDKDQLIAKIVAMELNALLHFYRNQEEEMKMHKSHKKGNRDDMTRFFINLGRKDKLRPQELIGMINDLRIAKNIEIGDIDILRNFSFFEVETHFAEKIIKGFENVYVGNRKISVEISNPKGSGGHRKDNRKGKKKKRGVHHQDFGGDLKSRFKRQRR